MSLRSTAILAATVAAATALPASPASARLSRVAYFKVAFVATQTTTWNEDITAHDCGGVQRTTGHGGSSLRVRTPAAQPAVARQVHGGGREELLTFRGGTGSLPVLGSVSRDGTEAGQVITPGPPGVCPRPESTPRDCGTRAFPANTTMGITAQDWTNTRARHSGDLIYPIGPYNRSWVIGGAGFLNCPFPGRDDVLVGASTDQRPALQALLLSDLFGKRRRFTVRGDRVQKLPTLPAVHGVTGSRSVSITTTWELRFTRLAHKPAGL